MRCGRRSEGEDTPRRRGRRSYRQPIKVATYDKAAESLASTSEILPPRFLLSIFKLQSKSKIFIEERYDSVLRWFQESHHSQAQPHRASSSAELVHAVVPHKVDSRSPHSSTPNFHCLQLAAFVECQHQCCIRSSSANCTPKELAAARVYLAGSQPWAAPP